MKENARVKAVFRPVIGSELATKPYGRSTQALNLSSLGKNPFA